MTIESFKVLLLRVRQGLVSFITRLRKLFKRKKSMKQANYPKTLYKYRSWTNANHRKILTENQLYLSSPADFNDPIDCRIPTNYELLDTDKKKAAYSKQIVDKHRDEIIKRGDDPEVIKQNLYEKLKTNLDLLQYDQAQKEFDLQDKHYGILSLSERDDSILMWSHYGENHTGICIGLNEKKLRSSGKFGSGGRVTYKEIFPIIDPLAQFKTMEKAFIQTHSKTKDWEYEQEYRFTKLSFPEEFVLEDRLITVDDSYFDEVIIGLNTSAEHKNEIVSICHHKNIPVFQIEQVPFEFKLIKKTI